MGNTYGKQVSLDDYELSIDEQILFELQVEENYNPITK